MVQVLRVRRVQKWRGVCAGCRMLVVLVRVRQGAALTGHRQAGGVLDAAAAVRHAARVVAVVAGRQIVNGQDAAERRVLVGGDGGAQGGGQLGQRPIVAQPGDVERLVALAAGAHQLGAHALGDVRVEVERGDARRHWRWRSWIKYVPSKRVRDWLVMRHHVSIPIDCWFDYCPYDNYRYGSILSDTFRCFSMFFDIDRIDMVRVQMVRLDDEITYAPKVRTHNKQFTDHSISQHNCNISTKNIIFTGETIYVDYYLG